MRILIVEDEIKIAEVIASRLKKEQYVVDIFTKEDEDTSYNNIDFNGYTLYVNSTAIN